MLKLFGLLLMFVPPLLPRQANWTGRHAPCLNSGELRGIGHLRVGVRFEVSDPIIVDQFHRAFAFWAQVLDAEFFDEQSTSCAIAVIPATKRILNGQTVVARSQLPDRRNFSGWIAVDLHANAYLEDPDAVAVWIHEIGHVLGLKHSHSATSLMYYIDVDAQSQLEAADLLALCSMHTLRPLFQDRADKLTGKSRAKCE